MVIYKEFLSVNFFLVAACIYNIFFSDVMML